MSNNQKAKAFIKFFVRIILPSLLAMILFIMTLFFVVIPTFERAMMERKREMIREITNSASSILAKYYKEETDGILSREEAQKIAISRIQYLRYGEENKDYIFITNMEPRMIMHPYRPELNGMNLSDFEDSHGKKLFVESANLVRVDGHGYVDYFWQWKDDSTQIVPKLSFVKGFEPWDWIIGTGIYIDDVKKEINALSGRLISISIIIAVMVALILTFIVQQSHKIENNRIKAELHLKKSKEKYQSLVEASTEGMLIFSENHISFGNEKLLQLLQTDSSKLTEIPLSNLLLLPEKILNAINSDTGFIDNTSIETVLYPPGKEKIDVLATITPMKLFDNEVVIISIKDISTDTQIRRELFETKDRFKTLMDRLEVGIFRTTVDARGKFIDANETTVSILGYKDSQQLKEIFILDLLVERDDKKKFLKKLFHIGFVKNEVVKIRKQSGVHILVSVSLVIVRDEENNPNYCDGIIELNHAGQLTKTTMTPQMQLPETALYTANVSHVQTSLLKCRYNISIAKAAQIMSEQNIDHLYVISDQDEIIGIVTDKNIGTHVVSTGKNTLSPLYEIMTAPVHTVSNTCSIVEALRLMNKKSTHHLLITNKEGIPTASLEASSIYSLSEIFPYYLILQIEKAVTKQQITTLYNNILKGVYAMIETGVKTEIVFGLLSQTCDAITCRLIALSIENLGPPPCEFAFIAMGSEGRKEQSLKTDQDNALVYCEVEQESLQLSQTYFAALGDLICNDLNEIGYVFCKGNIMAKNPEWNQPLPVWKNYFYKWINTGSGKDLLDINIFFDLRLVYGSEIIFNELNKHIIQVASKNQAFLYHLVQNTMQLKPQLGFFGNILIETAGSPPETFNVKASLGAIAGFARINAIKHGISETNTLQRLQILHEMNVLNVSNCSSLVQSYLFLSELRIKHQAELIKQGQAPDNVIQVKKLGSLENDILKNVFSHISVLLTKLNMDFKG